MPDGYESIRNAGFHLFRVQTDSSLFDVPTAYAANQIPVSYFDPISQEILTMVPKPTRSTSCRSKQTTISRAQQFHLVSSVPSLKIDH
jgi:hypothetical protein